MHVTVKYARRIQVKMKLQSCCLVLVVEHCFSLMGSQKTERRKEHRREQLWNQQVKLLQLERVHAANPVVSQNTPPDCMVASNQGTVPAQPMVPVVPGNPVAMLLIKLTTSINPLLCSI